MDKQVNDFERKLEITVNEQLRLERSFIYDEIGPSFLKSFLWLAGGIFATWLGYEGAKEIAAIHGKGTYYVWWGAIAYGAIRMILTIISFLSRWSEYESYKKALLERKEKTIALYKIERTISGLEDCANDISE